MKLLEYLSSVRGRVNELAEEINAPAALISQWKNGSRQVPAERCIDIERATDGAVTCEELRPDLADRFAYLRLTNKDAA